MEDVRTAEIRGPRGLGAVDSCTSPRLLDSLSASGLRLCLETALGAESSSAGASPHFRAKEAKSPVTEHQLGEPDE